MWRPFWTPRRSTCGVRSCCSSQSGRLPTRTLASNLRSYRHLDATCQITWRPVFPFSLIWTPYAQSHGVRSAQLPRFGRLTLNHTASNFAALPKLDATNSITRRPFRTSSPIWTPRQSTCGVQSTLSSPFGRHATFRRHATSEFTRQYPRNSAKQNRQLPGFP